MSDTTTDYKTKFETLARKHQQLLEKTQHSNSLNIVLQRTIDEKEAVIEEQESKIKKQFNELFASDLKLDDWAVKYHLLAVEHQASQVSLNAAKVENEMLYKALRGQPGTVNGYNVITEDDC